MQNPDNDRETLAPIHSHTPAERFALMFGHIKPKLYTPPMSLSTIILGPYDDTPTSEKTIVSAAIPPEVKERLFVDFLPRRGAVDKVITRQLYALDAYTCKHPVLSTLSEEDREKVVHNLLNEIIDFLSELDPHKLTKQ